MFGGCSQAIDGIAKLAHLIYTVYTEIYTRGHDESWTWVAC